MAEWHWIKIKMWRRKTCCSSDFHSVAMNSFYSRKSAAPDICKYILLLQKRKNLWQRNRGRFWKLWTKQNALYIFSPKNINNNLYKESKIISDIVSFLWGLFSWIKTLNSKCSQVCSVHSDWWRVFCGCRRTACSGLTVWLKKDCFIKHDQYVHVLIKSWQIQDSRSILLTPVKAS